MDKVTFVKATAISRTIERIKSIMESLKKDVFDTKELGELFADLYKYSYSKEFEFDIDSLFKSLLNKAESDLEKL